jgi:hypothetical protein
VGIRGVIRDIIGIYLGFEIVRGAIYGNFTVTTPILIAGIALLVLGIWFILERIGILPQL